MEDMPKHPRLTRRGQVYWHRAAIPVDIKATYPKTEETFSLQTRDPREAHVKVRRAAAEVDERFAAHRRRLAVTDAPVAAELSKAQLARIEELYFAHLLDEDEVVRAEGFHEDGEQREAPAPTFEEHADASQGLEDSARFLHARGKGDLFFRAEAEEVLSWERRRAPMVLSLGEREEISRGLSTQCSLRSIARRLGRSPSTISREVRRNGGPECYRAARSDQAAWDRARRPKLCKLACCPSLARTVSDKLQLNWSPEQIAGWLKRVHPGEAHNQVSHETIYRSLFIQARGVLKKELLEHLRARRTIRRSRHASMKQSGLGQIKDAISIRERPAPSKTEPFRVMLIFRHCE